MSIARDTTAANIKPLEGHLLRRGTAGATVAAGEIVCLQSDGYWDPADGTSTAQLAVGVSLQAAAATGAIDIVTYGPVKCLTGATPGTLVYVGTGGEPVATAATKSTIIGYAESATVLFVQPRANDLS